MDVLLQTAPVDPTSALVAYGIAAPFAALCLWLLARVTRQVQDKDAEIARLNQVLLDRDRDIVGRLAPMLYDAGRAFKESSELVDRARVADFDELSRRVERLLAKLDAHERDE